MILPARQAPEPFRVFPENWDTVQMFLRMGTQWRTSPRGLLGLDYGVLQWLLTLYPAENARTLLEDLQVMESAALAALSKAAG